VILTIPGDQDHRSEDTYAAHPPAQDEFLDLINDFWYHTVWTAKKLRRGELWTAQGCSDSYMKLGMEDAAVVAASWRLLRERGATRVYPAHGPVRQMDAETDMR